MAGEEKILNVPWFKQAELNFCGPAVAQMFLDFFTVSVSQQGLWIDIKNNSDGTGQKEDPDFPQQVCYNCDKSDPPNWECWDTTPEALQKTIAGRTGSVALGVSYPSTFDDGVETLIESLDRTPAVPPLATTLLINHWVVVNGYLRDDDTEPAIPPEQVGKYNLNGIYILDPLQGDAEARVRLVGVTAWRAQFGLIDCSANPNSDKYPVVAGEDFRMAMWVRAITIVLLVSIVILLGIWLAGD